MKTSFVRGIASATLAAIGLWTGSALAAAPASVPQTLQQQGRILDSSGAPVSSKVHFVFSVYAKGSGGTALWTEEQDITLDDGYFSTELGSTTAIPAGLFDGSTLYLGVTVGNDDEMTPRQTVSSVPYAFLAGSAVSAATAASATSAGTAPFAALSGIPAPCGAGQYLKGYSSTGVASCATPTLGCSTYQTYAASATTATQGCTGTNEFMTGGGCSTNGYLTSSYPDICLPLILQTLSAGSPPVPNRPAFGTVSQGSQVIAYGVVGTLCASGSGTNLWTCKTTAAANIRAYATCCKVE